MLGQDFARLQESLRKSTNCVNNTDLIDKKYDEIAKTKPNIVVGFGFVTHDNGLSRGLPIDIYTMLLAAEKLRREVLVPGAKVHILIGDHFAFECRHESCRNPADVAKRRYKYIKKLKHILQNLHIEQHYVFQLSSEIIKERAYAGIRDDLEAQARKINKFEQVDVEPKEMISPDTKHIISTDTWQILNPGRFSKYDVTNREYFLAQTALFKYLFDKHGCSIKISWAKAPNSSHLKHSQSFDEPHFDRFYRELYYDHGQKLSFVYTKPGFAANRKDEFSKVIPYTAVGDDRVVSRILISSKQPLPKKSPDINPKLLESVAANVKCLKEINPEIEYHFPDATDIDAFYINATILRQCSSNPVKQLLVQFKRTLQLESPKVSDDQTQVKDQAQAPTCAKTHNE